MILLFMMVCFFSDSEKNKHTIMIRRSNCAIGEILVPGVRVPLMFLMVPESVLDVSDGS